MMQALATAWLASATPVAPLPEGATADGKFMDCQGVRLCGVLALETGLGQGYYHHDKPGVHGLWPQVKPYGSSDCVGPSGSRADPTSVFSCYVDAHAGSAHQLDFEIHEWEKHGQCAGARNATDYFDQICAMAAAPTDVMARERQKGTTKLDGYVDALKAAGYPVWAAEQSGSQVQLSACSGHDGLWKIAGPKQFTDLCGNTAPVSPVR